MHRPGLLLGVLALITLPSVIHATISRITVITPASGIVTEANIVLGGVVLEMEVSGMTFKAPFPDVIPLYDLGFVSLSSTQTYGWTTYQSTIISSTTGWSITNSPTNTIVNVILQPAPLYDITTPESISFSVTGASGRWTGTLADSMSFLDFMTIQITTGALVAPPMLETDIYNGASSFTLSVANDVYKPTWTEAEQTSIRLALSSDRYETNGFNNRKPFVLFKSSIVYTSSTLLTITFSADASYDITRPETLSICIPNAVLHGGGNPSGCVSVSGTFTISSTRGYISRSPSLPVPEAYLRFPNSTITFEITIVNAQFLTSLSFDAAKSQIGLSWIGTSPKGTGWNNRRSSILPASSVKRSSNTVITVTLQPDTHYEIETLETVTIIIPNTVLQSSASSGSVTIGTWNVSATTVLFVNRDFYEAQIVAGGQIIEVEVIGDKWNSPFNLNSSVFRDNLYSNSTQSHGFINRLPILAAATSRNILPNITARLIQFTLRPDSLFDISQIESVTAQFQNTIFARGGLGTTNSSNSFRVLPTSVKISGTTSISEDTVRRSTINVYLDLVGTSYVTDLTSTGKAALRNLLVSSSTGSHGFNARKSVLLPDNAISRTTSSRITLTIQIDTSFDISSDETVTIKVPNTILLFSCNDSCSNAYVTASNTLLFTVYQPTKFNITGTKRITENQMRQGGLIYSYQIWNDVFVSQLSLGSKLNLSAGIISNGKELTGWNARRDIGPLNLQSQPNAIRLINNETIKMTFQVDSSYDIATDEQLTFTIPRTLLSNSREDVLTTFTVLINATKGYSTQSVFTERDFASNALIRIHVVGDTWVSVITPSTIVSKVTSRTNEVASWNQRRTFMVPTGNVQRVSSTQVTLLCQAESTFDISSDETLDVYIPASQLSTGLGADTYAGSLKIIASTATVSGTLNTTKNTEYDVQFGGATIVVTIQNDVLIPSFTLAAKTAIQNSVTSAHSTTKYPSGWSKYFASLMPTSNIVRTSSTSYTITLAAFSTFSIPDDEQLVVTVPKAVIGSNGPIFIPGNINIYPPSGRLTVTGGDFSLSRIRNEAIILYIDLRAEYWKNTAGQSPSEVSEFIQQWTSVGKGSTAGNGWMARRTTILGGINAFQLVDNTRLKVTLTPDPLFDPTDPEEINIRIPRSWLQVTNNAYIPVNNHLYVTDVSSQDHACTFRRLASDGTTRLYDCQSDGVSYIRAGPL